MRARNTRFSSVFDLFCSDIKSVFQDREKLKKKYSKQRSNLCIADKRLVFEFYQVKLSKPKLVFFQSQ